MAQMKYKKIGWFRESWRHGLAARGVKTKYFAEKPIDLNAINVREVEPQKPQELPKTRSDERAYQEELSRKKLEAFEKQEAIEARPENRALKAIQAGRFT